MRVLVILVGILCLPLSVHAGELTVEGAEQVAAIDPESGYVGDAFAFDAAGRRLVWLHLGTQQPSARIHDLAQLAPLRSFDMPDAPWVNVSFALDGEHVFAVERAEQARGWLFGPGRSRSFGPAEDVLLVVDDGGEAALVHSIRPTKAGGARHFFETRDLKNGAKRRRVQMDLDARGYSATLDFQLHSFVDGFTRAIGEKGGSWDPEENQRTPNLHSVYDVLRGTFVHNAAISDLMEYRRTMLARQEHPNQSRFVYVDNGELYRVADDRRVAVELEEPLTHYDLRTVTNQALPDGALLFSIRIDPVHPDAARARRAETAWTDVYLLEPGATRAVRKARFVDASKRRLRWQATREFLAVLPGHRGFDRGGESLYLFALR